MYGEPFEFWLSLLAWRARYSKHLRRTRGWDAHVTFTAMRARHDIALSEFRHALGACAPRRT
jgi:hypothetical protein